MDRRSKPVFPIDEEDDLTYGAVVSSTECTGLIQTPPLSEAEENSYTDIYDIHQPENNILDDDDRSMRGKITRNARK